MERQYKECSDTIARNFVVDSRSRNLNEKANDYHVDLPENFKNIKSIELKGTVLPRTEYNVNSSNKYLDFSVGSFINKITYVGTLGQDGETLGNISGTVSLTIRNHTYSTNCPGDVSASTVSSSGVLSQTYFGASVQTAAASITPSGNSVGSVTITDGGLGYSNSSPPVISYTANNARLTKWKVEVGFIFAAELREGEYNIGGNPNFILDKSLLIRPEYPQSWVPSELLNEVEAAMSDAVLSTSTTGGVVNINAGVDLTVTSGGGSSGPGDVPDVWPSFETNSRKDYCYGRRSWSSSAPNTSLAMEISVDTANKRGAGRRDYPLLFTSRIMSQYPDISDQLDPAATGTKLPQQYNTNACNFNRVQITNCLIILAVPAPDGVVPTYVFYDDHGWGYEILASSDRIPEPTNNGLRGQIYFCKLRQPSDASGGFSATQWADVPWPGLKSGAIMRTATATREMIPPSGGGVAYTGQDGSDVTISLASYELLFGSGINKFTNCSNLLGFNKIDYGATWYCNSASKFPVLTTVQQIYNTITATGDIYPHPAAAGFPHTAIDFHKTLIPRGLSYMAENDWYLHGDDEYVLLNINGEGEILSDSDCNINGKFACIIYDTQTSAVLQGLSAGPTITQYYSAQREVQTSQISSFIGQQDSIVSVAGTGDGGSMGHNVLMGSVGTVNSFTSSVGGTPKPVCCESLTGKQIIEFENPIRNLQRFRIKFSKFNRQEELYDFKGKDHVLIFEIRMKKCNTLEEPPTDMEKLISAVNRLATLK